MAKYQVTWGADSAVVQAANENDAWAVFCQSRTVARVNPKLHERKILEVTSEPQRVLLVEAEEPVVEATDDQFEDDING